MALPFLLSMLGSGLAGASAVGMSPLLAGALGAGAGSALETGDLGEGIKTGLTAGLLGGIGGAFTGGAGSAASQAAQGAAGGAGGAGAAGAGGGIMDTLRAMPKGMSSVAAPADGVMSGGVSDMVSRGLNQGVMTGAGLGTALGGMAMTQPPTMDVPREGPGAPEPEAARRDYIGPAPGSGYRPGFDPEPMYFNPSNYGAGNVARLRGGGMVQYTPVGMGPMYMQAGGLADMAGQAGAPVQAMPEMNEKELVQMTIRAVRSELPEEAAAMVLGQFVRKFGEEALRKLVDDVQSGRANGPRGDVEGTVRGPGDGMDDMVPAAMDDGSQDVLLSDGEFVVPADVVSGLGNGSTDAGADELHGMMDRVRRERTGQTEQPEQVAMGGLMPA